MHAFLKRKGPCPGLHLARRSIQELHVWFWIQSLEMWLYEEQVAHGSANPGPDTVQKRGSMHDSAIRAHILVDVITTL